MTETGKLPSDVRVAIVAAARKASTIDDEGKCPVNYSCPPAPAPPPTPGVPGPASWRPAPERDVARAFGARWGLPEAALYADYETMLTRERPDLVSVCTQASLHAAVTIATAGAGVKGVLCEKAMATSLAEADAMLAACDRNGTRLMVDHPRRCHPTYPLARRALAEGEIGHLRAIVATAGGAIVHNGTHVFDLVRYFGGDVAGVSAGLRPSAGGDGDGHCQLELEGGTTAYVALHGGLPFSFELLGTDGASPSTQREGATLWRYDAPATSLAVRHRPVGRGRRRGTSAALAGCARAALPPRPGRQHDAGSHRRADRRRRGAAGAQIEWPGRPRPWRSPWPATPPKRRVGAAWPCRWPTATCASSPADVSGHECNDAGTPGAPATGHGGRRTRKTREDAGRRRKRRAPMTAGQAQARIRVGVIGTGGIARVHLAALRSLPKVDLAALCDTDPDRLAAAMARWGGPETRPFADYRQMLDDVRPDAVWVLVSVPATFAVTAECLRRGVDTMLEKPPGLRTSETRELADLATRHRCRATVAFNRPLQPLGRSGSGAVTSIGEPRRR